MCSRLHFRYFCASLPKNQKKLLKILCCKLSKLLSATFWPRVVKTLLVVSICTTLLAPRVSLTLLSALGLGFNSVVLCTGSGFVRVTVDASGEIVSDISENWESSNCTAGSSPHTYLTRAWQVAQYPQRHFYSLVPRSQSLYADLTHPTLHHARAPPLG